MVRKSSRLPQKHKPNHLVTGNGARAAAAKACTLHADCTTFSVFQERYAIIAHLHCPLLLLQREYEAEL